MTADAHKDNPLSNPDDYRHYISRVKSEASKAMLRKRADRKDTLSVKEQVLGGPLRSWMKRFAVWLSQQDRLPHREERMRVATKMAGGAVSYQMLVRLSQREDFQQYLDKLQSDLLEQARARYEGMFPQMMDLMQQALDDAVAEKNYKKAERIISQAVERFAPKKADPDEQPRTIHIHLNARTQKLVDATIEPLPDVEVLKAGEPE